MALLVSRPVPVNSAVRIDWEDALLVGYVCYQYQQPQSEKWRVGLQLSQVVCGSQDLARMLEQLHRELAGVEADVYGH